MQKLDDVNSDFSKVSPWAMSRKDVDALPARDRQAILKDIEPTLQFYWDLVDFVLYSLAKNIKIKSPKDKRSFDIPFVALKSFFSEQKQTAIFEKSLKEKLNALVELKYVTLNPSLPSAPATSFKFTPEMDLLAKSKEKVVGTPRNTGDNIPLNLGRKRPGVR